MTNCLWIHPTSANTCGVNKADRGATVYGLLLRRLEGRSYYSIWCGDTCNTWKRQLEKLNKLPLVPVAMFYTWEEGLCALVSSKEGCSTADQDIPLQLQSWRFVTLHYIYSREVLNTYNSTNQHWIPGTLFLTTGLKEKAHDNCCRLAFQTTD